MQALEFLPIHTNEQQQSFKTAYHRGKCRSADHDHLDLGLQWVMLVFWNPQTAHLRSVQVILSKVCLKNIQPKELKIVHSQVSSLITYSLGFSKQCSLGFLNWKRKGPNTWWSPNSSFQGLMTTFILITFIYSLTISYMYTTYHDPNPPNAPSHFPWPTSKNVLLNLMSRQFSSSGDIVGIMNPT